MTGRGEKTYFRQDNGKPISSEDIYQMVILYNYQKMPITRIARKFCIKPIQVRLLIGKRAIGGCCG
ncbi:MAG: hypothetical protein GKR95_01800 [Gammaproteobacteria bacterium]|nr:hypothetical protein [Gammaproteobacteria bacterium]